MVDDEGHKDVEVEYATDLEEHEQHQQKADSTTELEVPQKTESVDTMEQCESESDIVEEELPEFAAESSNAEPEAVLHSEGMVDDEGQEEVEAMVDDEDHKDIEVESPTDVLEEHQQYQQKVESAIEVEVLDKIECVDTNIQPQCESEEFEVVDKENGQQSEAEKSKSEPELSAQVEEQNLEMEDVEVDMKDESETDLVGDIVVETKQHSASESESVLEEDNEHQPVVVTEVDSENELKGIKWGDMAMEINLESEPEVHNHSEERGNAVSESAEENKQLQSIIVPEIDSIPEIKIAEGGEVENSLAVGTSSSGQVSTSQINVPLDAETLGAQIVKTQYVIRAPRFFDEGLKTELQQARAELDEQTRIRDSIKVEIQNQRFTHGECQQKLDAARAEERAARAAVSAKYQELDRVQAKFNQMKAASSFDDINEKVRKMEHTLQHETIPLEQEKRYMRDIKQMKQNRDQIYAKMGSQVETKKLFDQKVQIDDEFKTLRKEVDSLRAVVMQAESNSRAASTKCTAEFQVLRDLYEKLRTQDNYRQEAYGHMQNLRNELTNRNKYFNMYTADQKTATNYASAGNKEGLQNHCKDQVEKIMKTWNENDEFRQQYVKSNTYSTVRRFGTLDGRQLGPGEKPHILPSSSISSISATLPNVKSSMPAPVLDLEIKERTSVAITESKPIEQPNQERQKKLPKSEGTVKAMASKNKEVEVAPKVIKLTKEEEESARKAEEAARKEEVLRKKLEELERKNAELTKKQAAAELKERVRLEQQAKAKEAEERKRRQAEKAQAKAQFKAQKEAELREKKKAKKEKKAGSTETNSTASNKTSVAVEDAPPVNNVAPEIASLDETSNVAAGKKPLRPQRQPKHIKKMDPLPEALRNKGQRKMKTWMWFLLSCLLVVILFLAGNYVSVPNLPYFGF